MNSKYNMSLTIVKHAHRDILDRIENMYNRYITEIDVYEGN